VSNFIQLFGGTIFEVSAKRAVRHRAPQATPGVTQCKQKFGRYWSIHHTKPREDRCRKCYPEYY